MSDVKYWRCFTETDDKGFGYGSMGQSDHGDFVLRDDYDALRCELERCRGERNAEHLKTNRALAKLAAAEKRAEKAEATLGGIVDNWDRYGVVDESWWEDARTLLREATPPREGE
jgi:hypothetical protein